ncbi:MAG: hypothetical protein JWM89_1528 [Acidimicrobiales bacterium]|nr:hypothetical protein [Acidimicrobiales bacterium]
MHFLLFALDSSITNGYANWFSNFVWELGPFLSGFMGAGFALLGAVIVIRFGKRLFRRSL